ncbi:hypothetical protein BDV25DRAFT_158731 [Aspergillus avenaceus]|uniref:Proteophosphoglycan 5 n=1 Tax=Aspergillus avenaceus TaxID=36643 RepID=A0A5N6TPJ2_ASPAV|nr:hypothetical protein BDV25DRAFT_158731 [Aspergillus avenaceus]
MSTQSPTPPTPRGIRNNRRNPKRNMTPTTQKAVLLATPPSSPPRHMSPGGTATDSSVNLSKKKYGKSNKKPRDAPKASPAQRNGHRHTSSHANNATPQLKDSPHYAGPTFHASPAPSALPIPSFISKSMPDPELTTAQDVDGDLCEIGSECEVTPSKPRSRPHFQDGEPESTPLDFLFKAAVQARSSQAHRSPEAGFRACSPQMDSSKAQPKPKGSSGLFASEMESPEPRTAQIGPSFATSYKDRMDALRSTNSPSPPLAELDEEQRRAKTEALKNLLLNPRPQRPTSAAKPCHNHFDTLNEWPAAGSEVSHVTTPPRITSGPPSAPSYQSLQECNHYPAGNGWQMHIPNAYPVGPQPYGQYSIPRKERIPFIPVNSTNPGEVIPPPVGHEQLGFASHHAQVHYQSPVLQSMPTSTPTNVLDTKRIEDDLRRILKLDVSQGLTSNGIQSSYA